MLVAAVRENLDHHKRLSAVTEKGTAFVYFGEPYAISVLNPDAQVTVELLDKAQKRLAIRSARPGYRIAFPMPDVPDGPITFRATFPVRESETLISERRHLLWCPIRRRSNRIRIAAAPNTH